VAVAEVAEVAVALVLAEVAAAVVVAAAPALAQVVVAPASVNTPARHKSKRRRISPQLLLPVHACVHSHHYCVLPNLRQMPPGFHRPHRRLMHFQFYFCSASTRSRVELDLHQQPLPAKIFCQTFFPPSNEILEYAGITINDMENY
jgi:hypothetical protein